MRGKSLGKAQMGQSLETFNLAVRKRWLLRLGIGWVTVWPAARLREEEATMVNDCWRCVNEVLTP